MRKQKNWASNLVHRKMYDQVVEENINLKKTLEKYTKVSVFKRTNDAIRAVTSKITLRGSVHVGALFGIGIVFAEMGHPITTPLYWVGALMVAIIIASR